MISLRLRLHSPRANTLTSLVYRAQAVMQELGHSTTPYNLLVIQLFTVEYLIYIFNKKLTQLSISSSNFSKLGRYDGHKKQGSKFYNRTIPVRLQIITYT